MTQQKLLITASLWGSLPVKNKADEISLFSDDKGNNNGDTWEWNGSAWSQITNSGPAPRFAGALFYCPISKKTYLYSGHNLSFIFFKDFWRLDSSTWTLGSNDPLPQILYRPSVTYINHCNKIYLAAGCGGTNQTSLAFKNQIWEWDGMAFSLGASVAPEPFSSHSLNYDESTKTLILHGGYTVAGGDPGNKTWIMNIE